MKIIRLQSDNDEGKIYNTFNEDIIIDDNSKISLQNASFTVATEKLEIDDHNDDITYTVDGNERSIKLTPVLYSETTQADLLKNVQDGFNSYASFNIADGLGKQYSCFENGTTIIESRTAHTNWNVFPDYVKAPYGETFGNVFINVLGIYPDQIFTERPITGFDTNCCYSFKELAKGGGVFRTTVGGYINPADPNAQSNGFIIGLSPVNPKDWVLNRTGTDFNISLQDRGFYARMHDWRRVPNISYRTPISGPLGDGTEVDSEHNLFTRNVGGVDMVSPQENTFYMIASQNTVSLSIVSGYADKPLKFIFGVEMSTLGGVNAPLYPYLIIYSEFGHLKLVNTRVYMDPYLNDLSGYPYDDGPGKYLVAMASTLQTNKTHNMKINFESENLALALGFKTQLVTMPNNKVNFFVKAENAFSLSPKNSYFVIVSRNIHLSCYDAIQKGRMNILACIPYAPNGDIHNINWESKQLFRLDISNQTPRSLRDIQIEIYNSDLTRPVLNGMTNMVLMIE
jgi:hypothetical protein